MSITDSTFYLLAADTILVFHVLFIGFVIIGLLLILPGLALKWHWVRNFYFRVIHLAAIVIVVFQSWVGVICPLTIWENQLRLKAGQETDGGAFIQHWLHQLIFFQAEPWVFALAYTLFGGLVGLVWWLGPPHKRREHSQQ